MTHDPSLSQAICEHWRHRASLEAIRRDLQARGRPWDALTAEDLAAHDQLHAGGLEATQVFLAWSGLREAARVLDLGAGLGGSARVLASTLGCHVTALDLSPDLTATGREITAWRHLAAQVEHVAGEIETLPLRAPYDALWVQHLDIHLPHKLAFYAACRRHAAPGTRLFWHDWLAGPGGPARPPLPWSSDGALSFLAELPDFRALVEDAGWRWVRLEPQPDRTREWYRRLEQALARALDKPSLHGGEHRRAQLEARLADARSVLVNLSEERLVPFFGEARPA